jgi:tRNA-specific 2-thiouridylase
MTRKPKIAVGMSGGTDSTLVAWLLQQAGYDVLGITLELWPQGTTRGSKSHLTLAREVAQKLGIRHEYVDMQACFASRIVEPFVESYVSGETPSPCIRCNMLVKFGVMLDAALELGCDALATGHYARIKTSPEGRAQLWRGLDANKDQTYFLFGLSQAQLSRARFPLGEMHKSEVRAKAETLALIPPRHGESQDLCFLPDGDYAGFVAERHPELTRPGNIVTAQGKVLGRHGGFFKYTIGQRQGLGLSGGPWYVVALRPESNAVVVGRRDELFGRSCELRDVNWLDGELPQGEVSGVSVQLRYRMKAVAVAAIKPTGPGRMHVELAEPVAGITPGQAAVFYSGERLLGGGWICPDKRGNDRS